jgi:hypothetical protein
MSLLFYAFMTLLFYLNTHFDGLLIGQVDVSKQANYVMTGFAVFYALVSIL